MHETEDTVAFYPFDDELVPFTAAGEPENEIEEQLPKPAIVRTVLITGASLAGAVFGKTFNVAWVDIALDLYILVAPMALGYWVHRKVKAAAPEAYVGKHRAM